MKRVLFLNLPFYSTIFNNSILKPSVSPAMIVLGLPTIAASLKGRHILKLLDLNLEGKPEETLIKEISRFLPHYVCMTITTPTVNMAHRYASIIKKVLSNCKIIVGGPHPSALPEETLSTFNFDIVVVGEGDEIISEILSEKPIEEITGVYYKENNTICSTRPRPPIKELDSLQFPFMDLFLAEKYTQSSITARGNPVAPLETSRGCPYRCIFCCKSVFGNKIRAKSPERVIDEMEYLLSLGYREIHIIDDAFTFDMERAKTICREIIKRSLDLTWYPRGGVRVNNVDKELFSLMKEAGVWKIPFGIESGSQEVLNFSCKDINLDEVRKAVRYAKEAGLEIEGYFMFGLPGETEKTMKETIKFSRSLKLDYAKFAITIPLPGSLLFQKWSKENLLITNDWLQYNFATKTINLYRHPTVDSNLIDKFYKLGYINFYFNISYIIRKILKDLQNNQLLESARILISLINSLKQRRINETN